MILLKLVSKLAVVHCDFDKYREIYRQSKHSLYCLCLLFWYLDEADFFQFVLQDNMSPCIFPQATNILGC